MHGITVILNEKTIVGKDPYNAPIYQTQPVQVDNVLVAPVSDTEILEGINLHGKKAVYKLGIPKGDTHNWEDQLVEFFGQTWHTFGFVSEGIEDLVPTHWHKTIRVERYEI